MRSLTASSSEILRRSVPAIGMFRVFSSSMILKNSSARRWTRIRMSPAEIGREPPWPSGLGSLLPIIQPIVSAIRSARTACAGGSTNFKSGGRCQSGGVPSSDFSMNGHRSTRPGMSDLKALCVVRPSKPISKLPSKTLSTSLKIASAERKE